MRRNLTIGLMLLVTASCSNEEVQLDERTLGLQYFPLRQGEYRIYQVEKTQFFLNTGCVENSVSETFYIKETVLDSFANLEGSTSYRIARHSREKQGDPWTADSIWTARRDQRRAVMVENNVPIMKLSFPLEERRQWDGNTLNDREEDLYELSDVYRPYTPDIGALEFPRTVTVVQEDFDDLIVFKDQRREIYAEDVGLVYKEQLVVEYDSENSACIGERVRNAGEELRMYLIDYGNE